MNRVLLFILCCTFTYSCITPAEEEVKIFEKDVVVDDEGNKYTTVKIGNQWWMAEDLKSTKFKDGTAIKFVDDPDTLGWETGDEPKYSRGKYGNFYNHAVITNASQIAPKGWHVPSDEEWKILESYLGITDKEINEIKWRGNKAGDKLKDDYQYKKWKYSENIWGNNESGFSAMPCGCRLFDGRQCYPNNTEQGYWWTSSKSESEAWFRYLDYKKSGIFRYVADQKYGFAIRCVKD